MKHRIRAAALAFVLAGTALSAGQNPPAPPQAPAPAQGPTFKVTVDYVEVDVVVTDKQGNLVRDLKKEDFQVLEDGKPQTITTFTPVEIPVERADRPLYQADPIERDVQTNDVIDGRVYVMVIDDLHTNFGRTARVKAAAKQFIEKRFAANDLMAIIHTAGSSEANQEFTSNKRLLLASVDKTQGRKLTSATANKTDEYYRTRDFRNTGDPVNDPDDAERAFNARSTLDTLKNVADWFAAVRGRRKTILFLSEGIDYDIYDAIPGNNGSNHLGASMVLDSTRDAIAAATRANASIYGIDPRGLTDLGDESIEIQSFPDDTSLGIGQNSLQNEVRLAQDSLRVLSDETGGFAVVNRNDFANAFGRIVQDNSSYYVLAYYPPDARPGRAHKIDVRVTRPGLTVRARKAYVAPKKAEPAKTTKNDTRTQEVRDALDSPLPVSGLNMQVFAAPFKGNVPNASVLLGVEMRGRDLRLAEGDHLQVSYMAVDAQGKVRGGDTAAITMNLRPETRTRIAQNGVRMLNRLDLPPGRYRLRIAAHDQGGGAVGSVLYDLEVPDFSKVPIGMSGVVLTSATAAQRPTARPDEQLRQVLPGPPAAERSFTSSDELALFAEVYDNSASSPHKVDITTTITTDEGKVLYTSSEERDSSELGGQKGGYGFAARLPLKDIPPGRYVLTVSARSRVGPNPSVQRQVRIAITPPQGGE